MMVIEDAYDERYGPDIFGFQRSERLDVKKPGPPYKVNDYAFRVNKVLEPTYIG
jgi:hypothetical protein